MASTFTTRTRLEKQGDGENANTWGLKLNQNVIDLVDDAVAGYETVSVDAVTSISLTANDGTPDQARNLGLRFTGALTAPCTVVAPNAEKVYFVGRLAEYTYINTDEAIKRGLDAFQKIANSNGID